MSRVGLSGTYLAMVLIMQTITIPFSVWLMKSFIDEVPTELEEAARVDGAKWHTVILRITLPLVRPGLIVTSMFALVALVFRRWMLSATMPRVAMSNHWKYQLNGA